MKRIFLIRHASALPRESGVPDFERSLIPKGIKEAKRIAKKISKNGKIEGMLISSPANRSLETAHIFAKTWDYPVQKIVLKPELYEATSAQDIWKLIHNFDNDWVTVVIFGHDPSLSELAGSMANGFEELLPKSGTVGFSWDVENWSQVIPESGRLILLEFPKSGISGEKIQKTACKELAAALSDGVGALLAEIDPDGASGIKKRIKKSSHNLASDFLEKTKTRDVILSFWLRSKQKHSAMNKTEN